MTTHNEFGFKLFLIVTVLEDVQLFSFSWRPEYLQSNFGFINYLFNPISYIVERFTWPLHILILLNLMTIVACVVYCSRSLEKGRFKSILPLRILRFLSLLSATVMIIPIIESFVHPLKCAHHESGGHVSDLSFVEGYTDFKMECYGPGHIVLLVGIFIGFLFFFCYSHLMSLLFFDSHVKSKVGKSSGHFDCVFVFMRIFLVIMNGFVPFHYATIVNCIIIGSLLWLIVAMQPFHVHFLNNIRVGIIFAAWTLSIFSIIFSRIYSEENRAGASWVLTATCVSIACIPIGYFFNRLFKNHLCDYIVEKVVNEEKLDLIQKRASHLEIMYKDPNILRSLRGTKILPHVRWAEITARHVLSKDETDLSTAFKVFCRAFGEIPESAGLHLAYLNYISVYFTKEADKEHLHLQMILQKCKLRFEERFLLYQIQQNWLQRDQSHSLVDDHEHVPYLSYIEYESLRNQIFKYYTQYLHSFISFWEARRDGTDINNQMKLAEGAINRLERASVAFETLKREYPDSQAVVFLKSKMILDSELFEAIRLQRTGSAKRRARWSRSISYRTVIFWVLAIMVVISGILGGINIKETGSLIKRFPSFDLRPILQGFATNLELATQSQSNSNSSKALNELMSEDLVAWNSMIKRDHGIISASHIQAELFNSDGTERRYSLDQVGKLVSENMKLIRRMDAADLTRTQAPVRFFYNNLDRIDNSFRLLINSVTNQEEAKSANMQLAMVIFLCIPLVTGAVLFLVKIISDLTFRAT